MRYLSAGKQDFWISQQVQVEIKRGKACVEEALTNYFDGNNPWIPSHMPTLTVSHVSNTWAPTNKSCTSKTQNEKWKEAFYLQILELTCCSYVELFVDSHPKSHAKHNQLAGRIPEHRQAQDYYAKDYKRSCFGSEIKGRNSRNLTSCTNTHDRLKVRNASRICQKIINPLSMRWVP